VTRVSVTGPPPPSIRLNHYGRPTIRSGRPSRLLLMFRRQTSLAQANGRGSHFDHSSSSMNSMAVPERSIAGVKTTFSPYRGPHVGELLALERIDHEMVFAIVETIIIPSIHFFTGTDAQPAGSCRLNASRQGDALPLAINAWDLPSSLCNHARSDRTHDAVNRAARQVETRLKPDESGDETCSPKRTRRGRPLHVLRSTPAGPAPS